MKVDALLGGTLREAPAEGAAARDLGYDGLWSAELAHDPFLPLVRAADEIGPQMELGTSIAVAFARSPMTLANTAWDLQELTGGRFVLGLGSQVKAHIERRFSMPWSKPAARMRELVLAMRAIWASWQDGTKLQFEGEFYTHTLMTPMFSPAPLPSGAPKVLVAAVGDAMTKVAAEVADGLLMHSFTTRRYVQEVTLPAISAVLADSGRARSDFQLAYTPFIVSGVDEQSMADSARTARERIAFYASTPAYRPVLELHGWGELQSELNELARAGRWQQMGELIDDEMLGTFAVVAPVDELAVAYAEWVRPLADRTSFAPPAELDADLKRELIAATRAHAITLGQVSA